MHFQTYFELFKIHRPVTAPVQTVEDFNDIVCRQIVSNTF